MTIEGKKGYNKSEIIDSNVVKTINQILDNGNDAVIRRKGSGIVVMEESRKTKYDATAIGRK